MRLENKQIIKNQETLVAELKESFQRLEQILLADVEHKKDISQLKKESDLHFQKNRTLEAKVETTTTALATRMTAMEKTKSEYDGAKIYQRVPELWEWFQQEKGWRRFVPTAMAALAWIATMITFFIKMHDSL